MRTYRTLKNTGVGGYVVSLDPDTLDNGTVISGEELEVGDLVLFGASGNPTRAVGSAVTIISAADATEFWRRLNAGIFQTRNATGTGGIITDVTDNGEDNYDVVIEETETFTLDLPSAPKAGGMLLFGATFAETPKVVTPEQAAGWNSGLGGIEIPEAGVTIVGFDATLTADSGPTMSFTENNTRVTKTSSTIEMAKVDLPKSSGKWYFETWNTGINGTYNYWQGGLAVLEETDGDRIGGGEGYGFMDNGRIYHDNSYIATYRQITAGGLACFAVDLDTGKFYCAIGGSTLEEPWWQVEGGDSAPAADPSLGTEPLRTGLSGTFYPAIGFSNVDGDGTIKLSADEFYYEPPSGFLPWNS